MRPVSTFILGGCALAALALVWGFHARGDDAADAGAGKAAAPAAAGAFRKPSEAELKKRLTPLQYKVTQEEGTEPPFQNEFWNNKVPGIYVDLVSGEPLFASTDKYASGTGWPSFVRPLAPENVVEVKDRSWGRTRVEVRSKRGDSHLGHVFTDGPAPTGLRYCLNSAALRFVPAKQLVAEGYGAFAPLFGLAAPKASARREVATLAGGCFWGVEDIIRKVPGVLDTDVGYTGGAVKNPAYRDVKTGRSGHAEAVRVVFDPDRLSYGALLDVYFRLHDPTTKDRQGNDRGTQYRSAIFVHSKAQRAEAEAARKRAAASGRWKNPVVTQIVDAGPWTRAEGYHQDYLVRKPNGYTCHWLRD